MATPAILIRLLAAKGFKQGFNFKHMVRMPPLHNDVC
jgi:hypothetical protein